MTTKNYARSVRAKLLNISKEENVFYQSILTRYLTAAFLTFGRFGWLGKIAGAMLGMMLIGNNSNIKNIVSGDGGQGKNVSEAETTTRSGGMKR